MWPASYMDLWRTSTRMAWPEATSDLASVQWMAAGFCTVLDADGATATDGGAATGGATGEAGVNCRVATGLSTVVGGATICFADRSAGCGGGSVVTCFVGSVGVAAGSVFSAVEPAESVLATLNRIPIGLEELKANPRTMLAPSKPTSCQTIRRARESGRRDEGADD